MRALKRKKESLTFGFTVQFTRLPEIQKAAEGSSGARVHLEEQAHENSRELKQVAGRGRQAGPCPRAAASHHRLIKVGKAP